MTRTGRKLRLNKKELQVLKTGQELLRKNHKDSTKVKRQ